MRRLVAAMSAGALLVVGCSDDEADEPTASVAEEEESGAAEMVIVEFNEALLAGDAEAAEALLLPRLDDEIGAVAEFHASTVPGSMGSGGPGFPGTEFSMRDPFAWSGLYLDDFTETAILGSDGDSVTVRWVYRWIAPDEGWEFWCNHPAEGPAESPTFVVEPGATVEVGYLNEVTVSDDGLITRIEGTECGDLVSTSGASDVIEDEGEAIVGDDQPSDVDVALTWTLEASLDGWLEIPVVFEGGFGALDTATSALWVSTDGVDWAPAPQPPPGLTDGLVGRNGDLFAVGSLPSSGQGVVWALEDDGSWREVLTAEGLDSIAVGPQRSVVWDQHPFEILGVFDTVTLEQVDFDGLPDLGVEGVLYEGRVAALDDGFLAVVHWIVGPEEVERRMLHSVDGSTWVEHGTATAEEVGVWETSFWLTDVSYEGVNLVAGPRRVGSLLRTNDGLQFEDVSIPLREPVANEAGFFAFTANDYSGVYHSTDAASWQSLNPPPTWTGWSGQLPDIQEFSRGSLIAVDDGLVALVYRGDIGDWGFDIENRTTEIWQANTPDF